MGFGDENLNWVLLKELATAEFRGERNGEKSLDNAGLVRELQRIILVEQKGEILSKWKPDAKS